MEVIGNEGKEFTTRDLAKISKMLKDEVPSKVMEQMVDLSRQARDNSYSPYSKFRVGCCLLTENGEFILGRN
jgi:cytidine deaminase